MSEYAMVWFQEPGRYFARRVRKGALSRVIDENGSRKPTLWDQDKLSGNAREEVTDPNTGLAVVVDKRAPDDSLPEWEPY